ncbi:hypothetical protein M9Y10_012515 [Tritrichomonas musculus]|uniref:EF-hand domain-containing protein n=1 Tax=Tritrichomonas musculus TaxID=1915356 RepID=A0ABR2ICN6_9EUKA
MCEESYSNGSDVYAFAMIVYTIITGMASVIALMKKLQTAKDQKYLKKRWRDAYVSLLERCWAQDDNDGFVNENIDRNEFKKFIDFTDNYQTSFDITKSSIHFNTFIIQDEEEEEEEAKTYAKEAPINSDSARTKRDTNEKHTKSEDKR